MKRINTTSVSTVNGDTGAFYDNPGWRTTAAIDLKNRKIGYATTDLVLAIDYNVAGYDEEDLLEIVAAAASSKLLFREVWAVCLGSEPRVHLLVKRDGQNSH